jgi:beta-phosphoglucomutase-like phosphatase (HAD superfamily)
VAFEYEAVLFDLFGTLVDDTGSAIPGSQEILAALPAGKWAIVTSCGVRLAHVLLAHAQLAVPDVLVTADEVANNKPAPDGYLLAAGRLGAQPERCLVIEDSAPGIDASCAAGMDVAAILRGRNSTFARRATFTIASIEELRLRASGSVIIFEP